MDRPIITAKVGNLKKDGWIDVYADGWRIASIWGTGKATYLRGAPILPVPFYSYRLQINNTDVFLYVDAIEHRKVEPIKKEVVGVGV